MSVANLIKDILEGNFTSAEQRIKDWWSGVAPAIQNFLAKVESDEGKILTGLAQTAAQDVISGGLTTASFVAAALDVESKLVAQEIALARTDIFAALNMAVSFLQGQNSDSTGTESSADTEADTTQAQTAG